MAKRIIRPDWHGVDAPPGREITPAEAVKEIANNMSDDEFFEFAAALFGRKADGKR